MLIQGFLGGSGAAIRRPAEPQVERCLGKESAGYSFDELHGNGHYLSDRTGVLLVRCQIPKARPQADLAEDLLRLHRCPSLVVRVHPVVIPGLRQRPRLLQRENLATGESALLAPALDSLLRPEEQNRRSGEDEILIPSAEW